MISSSITTVATLEIIPDKCGKKTTVTGWWFSDPSEKYEFVNWDDEIPNISGKIKNGNQTTNQHLMKYKLVFLANPMAYHNPIETTWWKKNTVR